VQEQNIHRLFVVSVAAKGAHALIEIAGGLALYLLGADTIAQWIRPHEWAARHFNASEQHFYAFYLLSHGLVKSVIVVGLLREKLWAYPASFVVFSAFIAYQLYRYSYTRDIGLIAISIIDLIVMALAWNEYRLFKRHLHR
jgi:uncharacterized membrane protein